MAAIGQNMCESNTLFRGRIIRFLESLQLLCFPIEAAPANHEKTSTKLKYIHIIYGKSKYIHIIYGIFNPPTPLCWIN